jgi:hypothetical protein
MPWDEKKIEKMSIRLTPAIAAEVRALALAERRSFQDQLGVLVEAALQARAEDSKGNRGARRRVLPIRVASRRTEGAA